VARENIGRLRCAFERNGRVGHPSAANYLTVSAPDALEHFAHRDIAVRDCASFGLAGQIRVAAPPPAQLAAVLAAVAECGRDG